MSKHVLCSIKDVPVGGSKLVYAKGRPIALYNIDGEYFGLFNRCPHEGGNLSKGPRIGLVTSDEPGSYAYCRRGEIVRCPWHGWEFDIKTGKSVARPDKVRARHFDVEVHSHEEVLELAAETVPIEVEDQYLVVNL